MIEELFRKTGAIMEGHFLLTSGLHSPVYLEKFKILSHPIYTERLCQIIAKRFEGMDIQLVAGPTLGGVIIAYEVAKQLGVRAIFAEKEGERRVFRRGLLIKPGERVLIVDDILTTGGSIRETIEAVKQQGGEVVGIGVLVDRSIEQLDFGVPLFSCHKVSIPIYKPEDCPLCQKGIPLTRLGSLA